MSPCLKRILEIQLQGTEKQVLWAGTIRSRKANVLIDQKKKEVIEALRDVMSPVDLEKMNAPGEGGRETASLVAASWACSSPSAKWWIDTRDEDPMTWLNQAWWAVRKFCLEHPFK